ncbi:uncharacterized protein LAESUDRAFT_297281 [Laetiporus sulphureus 93-53]|uniref:Uncharacterized protein n=1 Tax=Laetiporus sulphureus 93-53 TaxID=1314785 RepID=A0A165DBF4_9APHY|nr:uncharacterized protein LAESUDRAFT_297281 [Laetiporus sulphureus 93-53]KZT04486.1 hypothetical protein LAESUDRAFT_297281 [Laetiporus sulphureus 93-53]
MYSVASVGFVRNKAHVFRLLSRYTLIASFVMGIFKTRSSANGRRKAGKEFDRKLRHQFRLMAYECVDHQLSGNLRQSSDMTGSA